MKLYFIPVSLSHFPTRLCLSPVCPFFGISLSLCVPLSMFIYVIHLYSLSLSLSLSLARSLCTCGEQFSRHYFVSVNLSLPICWSVFISMLLIALSLPSSLFLVHSLSLSLLFLSLSTHTYFLFFAFLCCLACFYLAVLV